MHFIFVHALFENEFSCALQLDLCLGSSIRHLAFRAQFLLADCVPSLSLAVHLEFACFNPSKFSFRAVIFLTSYR